MLIFLGLNSTNLIRKILYWLTLYQTLSFQPLLQLIALRRSPCFVGSAPTGCRAARCATTRSASRHTSSLLETQMLLSHSPAACSSQRGSTLDMKVFDTIPYCLVRKTETLLSAMFPTCFLAITYFLLCLRSNCFQGLYTVQFWAV